MASWYARSFLRPTVAVDANDDLDLEPVDPEQILLNQLLEKFAPLPEPVLTRDEVSETDSEAEEEETNMPSAPVQPINGLQGQDANERERDWLNYLEQVADLVWFPDEDIEELESEWLTGVPVLAAGSVDRRYDVSSVNLDGEDHFQALFDTNDIDDMDMDSSSSDSLEIYRENVKKLSTLFKDRPKDPLEEGVYWIEYILRHKGAPHLRSAGRKLNILQYHSYDVIAAYLTIIGIVFYVLYAMSKFISSKLFCRSGKSIDDKGTKKASNRKKMN